MDVTSYFVATFITWAAMCVAAGVAFTLFCVFGIPWLWHLLKPVLHTLTA
jgi:hypothetical protein